MARSKSKKTTSLPWGAILTGAMVATLVGGTLLGAQALMRRAREMRTAEPRVAITWPTWQEADGSKVDWLPGVTKGELEQAALEVLTGDPLDQFALSRAEKVLMATGWFSSIERVQRGRDGVVQVHGTWRVPVAVVREMHMDRLVTASGEVLPLSYPAGSTSMPVILNASHPAPEKMGEKWMGGDVQAGLKLLGFLDEARYKLIREQVVGIDVGGYSTNRRLALATSSNARVIWGEQPGVLAPAESTAEEKAARLLSLRQSPDFGRRIDAGRMKIDVSMPRGVMIDQGSDVASPAQDGAGKPESSLPWGVAGGGRQVAGAEKPKARSKQR